MGKGVGVVGGLFWRGGVWRLRITGVLLKQLGDFICVEFDYCSMDICQALGYSLL